MSVFPSMSKKCYQFAGNQNVLIAAKAIPLSYKMGSQPDINPKRIRKNACKHRQHLDYESETPMNINTH